MSETVLNLDEIGEIHERNPIMDSQLSEPFYKVFFPCA
jgi:hypothetical protein